MGIKNLKIILDQNCKSAINVRKLDSYRGMTLGIDISIFLYKYLYNNNDHLEGLTRLVLRLLKNHITPFFIFDGKPPKEKDAVLCSRKEKRNFMNIKKNLFEKCINFEKDNYTVFKEQLLNYINENDNQYIIDDVEIKNLFEKTNEDLEKDCEKIIKKNIYVTQYHIESSKQLFDIFGIKYIHAPCEAESLLAILCKNGIVNGCISEDTDILANGGQLFLREFNSDKNTVEEYCLYGILDNLKLTYDEFVDLCILCGSDYTIKIFGIGPISAYKLILKYKNIEEIIKYNDKYVIPDNFEYNKARELFKKPISDVVYEKLNKNTKMTKPNIEKLKLFLINTKLKDKYVKEIEKNLINYYLNIEGISHFDAPNNNKITDYFTKKI
jgi:flap endonuclease-1